MSRRDAVIAILIISVLLAFSIVMKLDLTKVGTIVFPVK